MRKSRLKKFTQKKLIAHFVAGATARCTAELLGLNSKTAISYFHRLRQLIYHHQMNEFGHIFSGSIEVDESYFGGKRKGKRGRGSSGKIPVFGLLKRRDKVYTTVIPHASSSTLPPIIQQKVVPDSIVYSDCWSWYNALDPSDFKHFRINHSALFAEKDNHINVIENFWNQAKRHMRKYNGIPKDMFPFYLKECEWRFNNPGAKQQLKQLRKMARVLWK